MTTGGMISAWVYLIVIYVDCRHYEDPDDRRAIPSLRRLADTKTSGTRDSDAVTVTTDRLSSLD